MDDVPSDPVEVLRRWESSGAVWRVLAQEAGQLTVGMFTCDGGEEAARITSGSDALFAFVSGRGSSEDVAG